MDGREKIEDEIKTFFKRVGIDLSETDVLTYRNAAQKLLQEVQVVSEKIGQLDALKHQPSDNIPAIEKTKDSEETSHIQKQNHSSITSTPISPNQVSLNEGHPYPSSDVEEEDERLTVGHAQKADPNPSALPTGQQEKPKTSKTVGLGDKLRQSSIDNLSEVIGISEKYMFIQELFKGNTERYLKELQNLNNCKDWDEAKKLVSNLQEEFTWNTEAVAYLTLVELIERKYPINE